MNLFVSKPIENGQKGKSFQIRFIEPGLVRYEDIGDVLVQKPALDAMAHSFVGCPVFNLRHQDTTEKDFSSGRADGVVTRVWYEPGDGWFWCEAMVWDPETIDNMRNGYSVSCAYEVSQWSDTTGKHHNIPYENEVLNGKYTHLAIVAKPRYEAARIIANQGGRDMKLMFWKKDQKPEEKPSEVELTNSIVEVEPGREVKMEEVIAGFKADQERKAKELANAKEKLSDDELVEIDGNKVSVKDLKAGYLSNLKNSAENSMAEDHEAGKHKEKSLDSCTRCNSERQNSEAAAAKKKADEELQNAQKAAKEARKRFDDLKNAQANGQKPKMPEPPADRETRLAAGAERYGATKN